MKRGGVAWVGCCSLLAGFAACARSAAPRDAGLAPVQEDPPLPGVEHPSPALAGRLRAASLAKGPTSVPPPFTNRLVLETSPYLLQHAHNPVNWYAWSDEAFERARREGKPVLVSIGYSTCHWCHVMEVESFEDAELARYLNQSYVCIKVDREERPDLDATYLAAVQQLGLGGGWPLNVWLTPDREPFFGGTYFPPRDGDRGMRRGFLSVLKELRDRFARDPLRIASQAHALAGQVRIQLEGEAGQAMPGSAELKAAVAFYAARFDTEKGGLVGAPKFPSSLPVRLMLRLWRRTLDPGALTMAIRTLERMEAGGIHDQVGGGFHRYATDEQWRVPHFEKMLYDNALLATAYAEAYQVTRRADFARVARDTLTWLERELSSPQGAFYSAMDADSPGGEGAFYTWTPAQLEAALGPAATPVERFFGVTALGDFQGRSVLHVPKPDEATRGALAGSVRLLYQVRSRRPPPLRDEKIIAAWNGLAISAFATAGRTLGEPHWTQVAQRAGDFAAGHLVREGRVLRKAGDSGAPQLGFLEDGALLIQGYLDLFEADGDPRWLDTAAALQAQVDLRFADPVLGGYLRTAQDQPVPLGRERPSADGVEPCGNSAEALNLLRLAELTGLRTYRQSAEMLLRGFGPALAQRPASLSDMLLAVELWTDKPRQVALVLPDLNAPDTALGRLVREQYSPNDAVWVGTESELPKAARAVPWLEGKRSLKGLPTAYVCTEGVCDLPTSSLEVLRRQLAQRVPLP